MPFRTKNDTPYGLICFGADGKERADDPDGLDGCMSKRLIEKAVAENVTNVFFFSHGWMGDVPAAIDQYDRWIHAFVSSAADLKAAETVFPGFRPMFIGLHWPSLPWGDEEIGGSFDIEDQPNRGAEYVYDAYIKRLGNTPNIRAALRTIFDEAQKDAPAEELSDRARQAFLDLNNALGLESNGVSGAPDSDREPFDPDAAFEPETEDTFDVNGDGVSLERIVLRGMLVPLRLCSYWAMKKRARTVGENAIHAIVNELQRATGANGTRIHLMGHSFGCVVVSSILNGPEGAGSFERPIDSVFLAQGAVSLWSYAPAIPFPGAGPGYFHKVIASGRIRGPLVTTQSCLDKAVGVQYPRASIFGQPSFDEPGETGYPKFGAVGTFGFQGLPNDVKTDREMLPADGDYAFQPGKIYNLEASKFIREGAGSSGAHNDIGGPEVAHAIWQAAFASVA